MQLVIGSKAVSSWSLRPWMVMKHFGIDFEEVVIPLDTPRTRKLILERSPAGRVPVLVDDEIVVWDSLAIVEYLADARPDLAIWPRARPAKALARSISAEMHSGFAALRNHCPCQFDGPVARRALTEPVEADVRRIESAWGETRARYGVGGPFLFGAFSAADAMFAPVVNRFHIYDIDVGEGARNYMQAIMDLPSWRSWKSGAEAETWRNGT